MPIVIYSNYTPEQVREFLGPAMAAAAASITQNFRLDPRKTSDYGVQLWSAIADPMVEYLYSRSSGSAPDLESVTTTGNITTHDIYAHDLVAYGDLVTRQNLKLNQDGSPSSGYVYWFDGTETGAWLGYDSSNHKFTFTNVVQVPYPSGSLDSANKGYVSQVSGSIGIDLNNQVIKLYNYVNDHAISGSIPQIGTPTYTKIYDEFDVFLSSGKITGGIISSGSSGIDVSAGTGFIRASNNPTAVLYSFNWPTTTNIHIPYVNGEYHVGVDYNSGNPQILVQEDYESFDDRTGFRFGSVIQNSGEIHIEQNPHLVGDHANLMIQRLYGVNGIERDARVAGIILGETGTRNVTVTAGRLWDKLNKFTISVIDTSGTDVFTSYYQDTPSGFVQLVDQTQWDNQHYDDGSGILATLTVNWFANLWFYMETDGDLVCVYGTDEYVNSTGATAELPPNIIPTRLQSHAVLIGRIIFQKGASTATLVQTAFTQEFGVRGVTDHGDLSGLLDDDHPQYSLTDGTRTFTGPITVAASGSSLQETRFLGTVDLVNKNISNLANPIRDFDATNKSWVLANAVSGSIAQFNSPTYDTIKEFIDVIGSAGVISGGELTSGSTGIDVAAGEGFIRASNNPTATLFTFNWNSGTISLPYVEEVIYYIGIDYNAGSPQFVAYTTYSSFNWQTNFMLGTAIVTHNGETYVTTASQKIGDHTDLIIRRIDGVNGIDRDDRVGGLVLGETGTRNVTVTSGRLWDRLNICDLSSFDTSGTDTFESYYRDGLGGFDELDTQTQWDNQHYDDNSGILATLGTNKYGVLWFYRELDGEVVCIYGRGQYANLAAASEETAPNSLPTRLYEHSSLVGRIIFQVGASTAALIQTVYDLGGFHVLGVTDHGDLVGLADDDHPQYTLADGTRAFSGPITVNASGSYLQETRFDGVIDLTNNLITNVLDPISNQDAATKYYVDLVSGSIGQDLNHQILSLYDYVNSQVPALSGWTDAGTDVHLVTNSDTVSVGTATTRGKLTVEKGSTTNITATEIATNTDPIFTLSNLSAADNMGNILKFLIGGSGTAVSAIVGRRPSANNSNLELWTETSNTIAKRATFDGDGANIVGNITVSTSGSYLQETKFGGSVDLINNLITNVQDPVSDQDAATKGYADAVAAAGGTLQSVTDNGNTTTNEIIAATLSSNGNIYVNKDGADGDQYIYFYDGSSPTGKYLMWDDDPGRFYLNDDLYALGNIEASSNIISNGYTQVKGNLYCHGNGYLNYAGGDGDSYLYFYENSSTTGASLMWDDSESFFYFDHDISVYGSVSTVVKTQTISNATDTIDSSRGVIQISLDSGAKTLTSTPTIQAGHDGQLLALVNVSAVNLTLQDNNTLSGSDLHLPANTITLGINDCVWFVYIAGTINQWFCLSLGNNVV